MPLEHADAGRERAIGAHARALRVVLVIALDRSTVGACLGTERAREGTLWPSTLYSWAAQTAARSPLVWRRCAEAIDDALARWLPAYDDAPVARVAEMLSAREAGAVIDARELAAALWAVLRRRDAVLACMIARLAMEAEIAIARAYVQLAGTRRPSLTSRSWGPREPEHVRAVQDRELPISTSPSGRGGPR